MRNSAFVRAVLGMPIGLIFALLVGTGASYLPDSPAEGFYTGAIVSSVLFVATLVLLSWTRGQRPLRVWLFDLHSFVGLATGAFLIVIVFSGALLLFRGEIETWSHEWLKVQPGSQFASVDTWLDAVATKVKLHNTNRIDIAWPRSSTSPVEISVRGPEGYKKFHVDPYRAVLLEGELSTWMDWVRDLHASLHLKHVGGWLLGLTCLGMAWLVASGLSMQKELFKDWRVLRCRMGSRILIGDLHKRLGTWLLPVVLLFAFSGMLLAFGGVLSAGPARILFDGDSNELYLSLGYPQDVSRTEQASMPNLESFVHIVRNEMPDARISRLQVLGFGDRDAIVSVRASRKNELVSRGESLVVNVRAVTKDVLYLRRTEDMGTFERIYRAFLVLHMADFDHLNIRILYAMASVGMLLLPILGAAMWLQRRRANIVNEHGSPPAERV